MLIGFRTGVGFAFVPAHDSHVGVFCSGFATAAHLWVSPPNRLLQVVRRGGTA